MPKKEGIKEIASNRKAFHDYFVLERFEAGIELFGTEVKSIRAGQVNLKDSYCTIREGELFVRGMHVSPYEKGNIFNRDPVRIRRLLMHKREIRKLGERVAQDGVALVPLSLSTSRTAASRWSSVSARAKSCTTSAIRTPSATRSGTWTAP